MKLGDYEYGLGVPQTVLYDTKQSGNPDMTEEDKKTAILQYFLNNVAMASWQRVAGILYYREEETALQEVKKFLTVSRGQSVVLSYYIALSCFLAVFLSVVVAPPPLSSGHLSYHDFGSCFFLSCIMASLIICFYHRVQSVSTFDKSVAFYLCIYC